MAAWEGYRESKSSTALKNKHDNHAILYQTRSCYDTLTNDGQTGSARLERVQMRCAGAHDLSRRQLISQGMAMSRALSQYSTPSLQLAMDQALLCSNKRVCPRRGSFTHRSAMQIMHHPWEPP